MRKKIQVSITKSEKRNITKPSKKMKIPNVTNSFLTAALLIGSVFALYGTSQVKMTKRTVTGGVLGDIELCK